MNIDFENIIRKNIPYNSIQPRRAQIYVGFKCHQKCGFCYYKHKCTENMFKYDNIKKQIDFEYLYGIRDFEITGGEPAEYKDLRKICEYIKSFRNTKIAVITNGSLWKSDIWDIIDEVLISYHLSNKAAKNRVYDISFFPRGCTFDKVLKTVELAKQNNILIRTNTVIGMFNIDDTLSIINDLIEFRPAIINFLPVNLFEQATNMHKYIDYAKLRKTLKIAIEYIYKKLSTSLVYIRYMPFCDMNGYEKHIVGQLQHIYDWFDWNREIDGTKILQMIENFSSSLIELGRYGTKSISSALDIRKNFYEKTAKCLKCKYYIICDGIEKTSNSSLTKYIIPTNGKIETNILKYLISSQSLYSSLYDTRNY